MSSLRKVFPTSQRRGLKMLRRLYHYCSASPILDALQAPGNRAAPHRLSCAPGSRPGRAPMTPEPKLRPASAPALPGFQRPAGTALSRPSQSAELRRKERRSRPSCVGSNWPAKPSLTRRHSVPACHTPLQKKRRLGRGGRQPHRRSGGARS